MRKFIYAFFLILSTVSASANTNFQCFDWSGHLRGRMVASDKVQFEVKQEHTCNGGFGDPIVCEDVVRLYRHRKVFVEIAASPKPFRAIVDTRVMTWKGADHSDLNNLFGATIMNSRMLELRGEPSSIYQPSGFSHVVKIYAPNSNLCDVGSCLILRCRIEK